MKFLDEVKLINAGKNYQNYNLKTGMVGTIIEAAIRDNYFLVAFSSRDIFEDDIIAPVKIEDLTVVKKQNCSDKMILDDLPKQNPKWWCKVEKGYILNLLGEKKNKIPYDYNS